MKVDCVVKLNSYVICEMAQNAHMNHDLREIGSWLMIDPPWLYHPVNIDSYHPSYHCLQVCDILPIGNTAKDVTRKMYIIPVVVFVEKSNLHYNYSSQFFLINLSWLQ